MTGSFGYLFNRLGHSGAEQAEQYREEHGITRPLGVHLPGTQAGESAAQYWANLEVTTGNPMYAVPGALASLWTPGTAVDTLLAVGTSGLGGIRAIPEGIAIGTKSGFGIWAHTYRNGGGGINIHFIERRVLAVDYHSFKFGATVAPRLHYHRGLSKATWKLHRPYQGGW
jgi:hypothetical protein